MNKTATLIGLCLFYTLCLSAQQECDFNFFGKITDERGEPLPGATISVGESVKAVTDELGNFRLGKLCSGRYTITVKFMGFEDYQSSIVMISNLEMAIALQPEMAQLEEVVVRAHQAHTEHVHNSATLNAKELAEVAGKSLGEALKEIPGINSIQAGPGIFKPVIHGVHSQRILILNYGIRQEGQQWGAEHAPEIDPFIASNIVVIKDAAAIKYGTDALGGVIVVNPPDLPEKPGLGGSLNVVGQSNGRSGTVSGFLEGGIKKHDGWGWRVQGTAKQSGDYRAPNYFLTNTGGKELNFSSAVGLHKENYGVEVFFSRFSSKIGILKGTSVSTVKDLVDAMERPIPQYTSAFGYGISEPHQAVTHQLLKVNAHAKRANGEWRMQYGYQHNTRQEFDLRRGTLQNIPALDLLLQTHTLETEWEKDNRRGQTLCLGVTGMAQENSNVPGTKRIPFIPNFVNYSSGIFAVAQKTVRQWKFDAGVRYDYRFYKVKGYDFKNSYYEDKLSFSNVSTTIGATVKLNRKSRVGLNASTAWRPPHVAELYSVGAHQSAAGIEYGLLLDPESNEVRGINEVNFRNEQAVKVIASYHFEANRLNFTVSGFGNYIGHFIFLKPSGITENIRGAYPYFRYDQTNVLFAGLDMSGMIDLTSTVKFLGSASIIRAFNQGNTGELPFIPPNRYDLGLKWQPSSPKFNFFLESKVKLISQQRNGPRVITAQQFLDANEQGVDLLETDNRNFDFAQSPNGYYLLNCAGGFSLKIADSRLDFRVSVENGLNTTYREYTNRFRYFADDRGRNFILSLQYQL